jgi:hypothetical protein
MTTSGTSTFNYTRDQIIRRSFRQLGAFASGETPDAQSVQDASDALNALVKEWDALGIHLWTESEGVLFMQPGQVQYALGPGSTDRATQTNPPNFVQTTLTANVANGASSVSLSSIANILSGDTVGITVDNSFLFWTTVNGAPSGNTITLTNALTDSATSGNVVLDYTAPILRPLRVVAARRFNLLSQIDVPMILMSRLDYRDLPNKTTPGTPTQVFYDPLLTLGQMYVWPAPVSAQDAVKFTWYRQIQDFNTPANTPDLPQEWINALVWNLSLEMTLEYDVPPQRYEMIKERAAVSLDRVTGFDREPESIRFGVQLDGQPFSR